MEIRRHLELPESEEDLPLVTESATVAAVEAMDHNRNDEMRAAAARWLEDADRSDLYEVPPDGDVNVDWEGVERAIEAGDVADEAAAALGAIQDRVDRPYPSLLHVVLETEEPVGFSPGQFVAITYEGTPRVYSLAGAPGSRRLELCIRRVPGGTLTSELFTVLEPGDAVTVRGPYGEMTLSEPTRRDLVFLATGTGVAPFKSMIDYVFENDLDAGRDVWLFLGVGWEDDLAFREEFRERAAHVETFHFVPTLSRESYVTDWPGETAYVQFTLAKYLDDEAVDAAAVPEEIRPYLAEEPAYDVDARLDPANVEVYACGVSAMVKGLVDYATALGVSDELIEAEGFG